ncbi:hypothetical protein [Nocardioides zeae]
MGEQPEGTRGSRGPRTSRGRVVLGAAAAAVALVAGTFLAVELTADAPAPAAQTGAGVPPERVDGAIAPRDGWRWVERGSLAVQVPVGWVDVSLTCGSAWDGGGPAVASAGRTDYAVTADCVTTPGRDALATDPVTDAAFPPVPQELWRTILVVEDADVEHEGTYGEPPVPDGTYTYDGWTLTRTTHGDVRVNLLVEPGDEAAASVVLASVSTGDLSPAGCRTSEEFGRDRDQPGSGPDGVAAATTCGYQNAADDRDGRRVHAMEGHAAWSSRTPCVSSRRWRRRHPARRCRRSASSRCPGPTSSWSASSRLTAVCASTRWTSPAAPSRSAGRGAP